MVRERERERERESFNPELTFFVLTGSGEIRQKRDSLSLLGLNPSDYIISIHSEEGSCVGRLTRNGDCA